MKDDGTRLNPIQSNNIFILNKIKYTQMEAISNFFFGKEQDLENPDDQEIRARYNFQIKPEEEQSIKIEKLYIYPMRGVMGIEVPQMKVSKFGIKYDREWSLFDTTKLSVVHQVLQVKLTELRQRIEKNKETKEKWLIISIIDSQQHLVPEGLPVEIRIPIRKEVTGEIIDTGKVKGVAEGKEFDQWFSKFLGVDVILLRSAPGFKKGLPMEKLKWGSDQDLTKGFVSKAAIHIINEASIRDLSKRVDAQYSNEEERNQIQVSSIAMRPNIIIDTKEAY